MKQTFVAKLSFRLSILVASLCLITMGALFLPVEVFARVGGGQSYGGGSGSGGGDGGGAIVWILFQVVRLLLYLTIEYPVIGIPLDIIVIAGVIYYFMRRGSPTTQAFSSIITSTSQTQAQTGDRSEVVARSFAQLRKFDPNFSEIVFTDFCYALYAKAHEARGRGTGALDLFSPYLSEAARKSLLQRNPPGLQEKKRG